MIRRRGVAQDINAADRCGESSKGLELQKQKNVLIDNMGTNV
jgi:hypothetical protein